MLKSRLVLLASVVILSLGITASVHATGALHTNYLTFSAPVALPGVALPAGTYIFEVVIPGSADVVRVTSRDGAHVYVTAFTRRVDRPAGLRAGSLVVFNEVPAGMTPPVKAWFPIGESMGHEFIYPANSRQLGTRASN